MTSLPINTMRYVTSVLAINAELRNNLLTNQGLDPLYTLQKIFTQLFSKRGTYPRC